MENTPLEDRAAEVTAIAYLAWRAAYKSGMHPTNGDVARYFFELLCDYMESDMDIDNWLFAQGYDFSFDEVAVSIINDNEWIGGE